jgi:hypothetical protein
MRRLLLSLAVAVATLVVAPAAFADGPLLVTQGGTGVATHDGAFHYVAVPIRTGGTLLEKIRVHGAQVYWWMRLYGSWGNPALGSGSVTGEGLSHDGKTLVLASTSAPYSSPSRFLIVDPTRTRVLRTITLKGWFTFDALSPNGSRMYLIQYTHGAANDVTHYIVRSYDMRKNRLLPGKIVARSEDDEKTMSGYAMTRTTSANGRWVYTLYQKPSGEPFIHALDTVGGIAYCIDLPANKNLYNIALSLRNGGRTLAAHWRSGRPWLNVSVGTWEISTPSSGVPWAWVASGIGGGLALLSAGGLVLWRRRREEVQQRPREELGLA